ncbi:Tripartite tricarboxylate transporter family receptor [Pigmentiphaga humi]|uniref:Tripartite tricarboxylate transporter family receptor n=1 Tax=Pigmentiphaga humi TaxID=2478468 RepID=A0A3P4B595_9BURK|nr:tripartite tricarboxylate transporter substrate binding protein [Pigmentiphaga humi]VCU71469.1 Tripartite tricarboxylate transporter family receptor [Pigmentiphaga humi]
MKSLLALFGFAVAVGTVSSAAGAEFPVRPIKFVIPFTPGGSADVTARILAPRLMAVLGQPVVVENRAGGSGIVATQAVHGAAADGYTLLMLTPSHTANPVIQSKLPYDTLEDFVPVAMLVDVPGLLVINSSLPVSTLPELLDYAKTHRVSYSSAGVGTFPHLGVEDLASRAGVPMLHVAYKGAAPALNDLIAGHVDMKLDGYTTSIEHIKAGKLRAIAATSTERLAELPDTPTVAELGFPGFETSFWMGVAAPAGTPPAVVAKLQQAFIAAFDTATRERLANLGVRVIAKPGDELDALVRREIQQWSELAKRQGFVKQ